MKDKKILSLLFSLLCAYSSSVQANNKDSCTDIAEECNCKNTGRSGLCFPALFTDSERTEGDLYCDCGSDVLGIKEILDVIVKKYESIVVPNDSALASLKAHHKDAARALNAIVKARKALQNTEILRTERSYLKNAIKRAQKTLIERLPLSPGDPTQGKPSLISYFVEAHDGCYFYGQKCKCSNTGAEGVCAIDRQDQTKLYCHCGG